MTADQLKIRIREKSLPTLLACGMNKMVLTVRPFTLRPCSFTSTVDGLKPKYIESPLQLSWFTKMLDEPRKPWCFCISSEPNDRLAKAAAAFLMQNYLMRCTRERRPMWHDLMGNFDNPLIGENAARPGFLILSNVMPSSTNVKLEKLKDILEYHTDIPKIVVTTGGDPFSFFSKYIKYPLSGCLYLKTSLVKSDIEV